MKKIGILLLTIVVALSLCVLFTACSGGVKLTFDRNDGTEAKVVKVKKGETYNFEVPTREGYVFDGWFTDKQGSGEKIESVVVESDATFYAKWTQVGKLTLDFNGGKVGNDTQKILQVPVGANVYDAIKTLAPQKSDFVFGAWFDGNTELDKTKTMSAEALTLKAKYKVGYTVEIYLQNEAGDAYEKDAQEIKKYEYPDTTVTATHEVAGFVKVANSSAVETLTLSANAQNNVFKLYFDRKIIEVSFDSNYPDGSAPDVKTETVKYGEQVAMEAMFSFNGYVLAGWATSPTGEIKYRTNYLDSIAQNIDGEKPECEKVALTDDVDLYAIWLKGKSDLFGGDDYVFIDGDKAYFVRAGLCFAGQYRGEEIYFKKDGKTVLQGKVLDEGEFYVYRDEARDFAKYSNFIVGRGVDSSRYFILDQYNGVDFVEKMEGAPQKTSKGSLYKTDDGLYLVKFYEGARKDTEMIIRTSTVVLNDREVNICQIYNAEEVNMGEIYAAVLEGAKFSVDTKTYIVLDGLGIAKLVTPSGSSEFNYVIDEEKNILSMYSGSDVYQLKLVEVKGQHCFIPYNSEFDNKFEGENGTYLTLDGVVNATYFNGIKTIEGVYTTTKAILKGYIVELVTANSETYRFLIDKVETKQNNQIVKTDYLMELVSNKYNEYYYQGIDSKGEIAVYYCPLLVIDADGAGTAHVYARTKANGFFKYLIGTYTYNEAKDTYVFTVGSYLPIPAEIELLLVPYDLSTVKSFEFALDYNTRVNNGLFVSYWYSYTDKSDKVHGVGEVLEYTGENGAKLVAFTGFAKYTANGETQKGEYEIADNILTFVGSDGKALYFELDNTQMTFVKLGQAPYTSTLMVSFKTVATETIIFNGKVKEENDTYYSEAIYRVSKTVKNEANEEEEVNIDYIGTVALKKSPEYTDSGFPISTFSGKTAGNEEITFNLVDLQSGNRHIFVKEDTESGVVGRFNNDAISASVRFDGYCLYADYSDGDGTYRCSYEIISTSEYGTLVLLTTTDASSRKIYIDVDTKGTSKQFTQRSEEYAKYLLVDNQTPNDDVVELDGYNKARVFKFALDKDGNVVEDEDGNYVYEYEYNGTYTLDGKIVTIKYMTSATNQVTLVGYIGLFGQGTNLYRAVHLKQIGIQQIYLDREDWSVLQLDDFGNAIKYNKLGVKETGTYKLVTDNMLYFANDNLDKESCVYYYDVQNGEAIKFNFEEVAYYTSNLDTLKFATSGKAQFGGETVYYYEIVKKDDPTNGYKQGDVLIYRPAREGETGNKYGFVVENFGALTKTKEYNYDGTGMKTYYKNSGFSIAFSRQADTANKYPLPLNEAKSKIFTLYFAPDGKKEYTVKGRLEIEGIDQPQACYVIRKDGKFYISVGGFSIGIEIDFKGEEEDGSSNSSYYVTSLEYQYIAYNPTYINYAQLYALFGMILKDDWGTMTISKTFDENGDPIGRDKISSNFGKFSNLFYAKDDDGNYKLISFDKVDFEYDEETKLYTVTVLADDEYTYKLTFNLREYSGNVFMYGNLVFTRVQELTFGDYKLSFEKILMSSAGRGFQNIVFTYKGEEIKIDTGRIEENTLILIQRAKNDAGKIISTKYYYIAFTSVGAGEVGFDDINPYASMKVTVEDVETIYSADGKSYVDIGAKGVLFIALSDEDKYFAEFCEFNAETNTYTVSYTALKFTFTVVVKEENGVKTVEITKNEPEEQ